MHPEKDPYYFNDADEFVEEAEKHGHAIIGHTLVWHAMAPPWIFKDKGVKRFLQESFVRE